MTKKEKLKDVFIKEIYNIFGEDGNIEQISKNDKVLLSKLAVYCLNYIQNKPNTIKHQPAGLISYDPFDQAINKIKDYHENNKEEIMKNIHSIFVETQLEFYGVSDIPFYNKLDENIILLFSEIANYIINKKNKRQTI